VSRRIVSGYSDSVQRSPVTNQLVVLGKSRAGDAHIIEARGGRRELLCFALCDFARGQGALVAFDFSHATRLLHSAVPILAEFVAPLLISPD
jgi:hypothetical protein